MKKIKIIGLLWAICLGMALYANAQVGTGVQLPPLPPKKTSIIDSTMVLTLDSWVYDTVRVTALGFSYEDGDTVAVFTKNLYAMPILIEDFVVPKCDEVFVICSAFSNERTSFDLCISIALGNGWKKGHCLMDSGGIQTVKFTINE